MQVRGSLGRAARTLRASTRASSFPVRWLLAVLGVLACAHVVLKMGSFLIHLGQPPQSQHKSRGRSRDGRGRDRDRDRDGNDRGGEGKVRKFYIYDWDAGLTDLWPANYTHKRLSLEAHFKQNSGAGRALHPPSGLYHTHQYALFSLFLARLHEHPRRTADPSQASLFFIPYDLGMDATTRQSDGALVPTHCPRLPRVLSLLAQSGPFKASQGADHFLLHSVNQMMTWYVTPPCQQLLKECFNCTKLSIDTYTKAGMYTHLDEHPYMTHK
jgi:hypothetical protein